MTLSRAQKLFMNEFSRRFLPGIDVLSHRQRRAPNRVRTRFCASGVS